MSKHHPERLGPTEMVTEPGYDHPINAIGFMVLRMLVILKQLGNQPAIDAAEQARAKFEQATERRYDWEQTKGDDPIVNEGAQEIDDRIDRTLTHLKKGAETYTAVEAQTEEKELAEEFLDELFANGVFPITSQPFAEQYTTVRHLLQRLNGPFAEHVEKLNLTTLVDQLEDLNEQFRETLRFDIEQVTYDEVQAAEAEAKEAFHKLLIQVMCDYKDDLETFHRVMAPLHQQRARMKRMLKHRANVPPIDPETGRPIDPETGEPVDPNPDGGESGGQNDGGSPAPEGETDGGSSEGNDSTDDSSEGNNSSGGNDSTDDSSDGDNDADDESPNS